MVEAEHLSLLNPSSTPENSQTFICSIRLRRSYFSYEFKEHRETQFKSVARREYF